MSGTGFHGRQAGQRQDVAAAGEAGAAARRPLMVSLVGKCVEFGGATACIVLAIAVWRGERDGGSPMKRAVLIAAAAAAAAAAWWWTDQAPYPYAQRWLLDLPLPFLTNRRLDALLGVGPGERVLEVGPGTGLQALHVAGLLGADGRLDIADIQQPMLDHVMRRAATRRIGSIVPARADARELPFDDASFDAAYLVTVLGEIPDPAAAMRELRRVLKPGGRLVVGEFADRHYVPLVTLLGYANNAGLRPSVRLGPPLAYFARFERSPGDVT